MLTTIEQQYVEAAKKLVASRPDIVGDMPPQQRSVCELLVAGLGEKQIAEVLTRSRHTIHDHTKRLYAAIGVDSRAHLVLKFTMPEVLL